MPTVHNPLGIVAGLARREAIVEVARAFDLVIVEDDAYGFLEAGAPPSYAALAPERTMYVRGISKHYAPAARTGFMVVPEAYAGRMEKAILNTTTGSALVHNVAALALIEHGTLERVMEAKRVEGAARNALGRGLLGEAAGPGARCAWHLWVSLPEGLEPEEAQRLFLERGVMVSGAAGYAVPGTEVPRAVRVGLGGEVAREKVADGIRILGEVIRR